MRQSTREDRSEFRVGPERSDANGGVVPQRSVQAGFVDRPSTAIDVDGPRGA